MRERGAARQPTSPRESPPVDRACAITGAEISLGDAFR